MKIIPYFKLLLVFFAIDVIISTYIIETPKLFNKTHFICDDQKILNINKFNDDYCDCVDGSDENSKLYIYV